MNKLYASVLSVCLLTLVNVLNAQQQWCATATIAQRKAQSSEAMAERFGNFINMLQGYQNGSHRAANANDIVYVPVVFHIVHNGDAEGVGENISEAQIVSQIDALNRDFNFMDPDIANIPDAFRNLVADCKIQFCLAKYDPSGLPTTGIVRHQFSQATWNSDSLIDNVLKPATIWDNKRYLNIWSVRMGGSILSEGVLAYATFPGFGPADEDGIVARYNTIGTVGTFMSGYEKGKTVSHEVGHWLGLLHTWGFGAGCGDQGDFISDTPDQDDLNFGCPTFPHFSCSGQPNGDMFMNYMDYTYDGCRNLFTLGQSERMHGILDNQRALIKQSATKCFFDTDAGALSFVFPADTICTTTFKPIFRMKNAGLSTLTSVKVYYDVDGLNLQTYNWSGSLASQEETWITLAEQSVAGTGTHQVNIALVNANGLAADGNAGNDGLSLNFYVSGSVAGTALPMSEGFESSLLATNWSLLNPNNDLTWEQDLTVGAYGTSSSSAVMNNRGYAANPNKKRDAIVTDGYSLIGIDKPELTFDVAYAQYNASRADTLNVYYSFDCGSNWINAFKQWGTDLATAADDTALFVPEASEWKTVSVPLLSAAGQQNVSVKFENVSGWGNAVYLDNINLKNNPMLGISNAAKDELKVFPNPAFDVVGVRLPFNHQYTKLEILNNIGQQVYELALSDNAAIISTIEYAAGLYYVRVSGNGNVTTKKLLITK